MYYNQDVTTPFWGIRYRKEVHRWIKYLQSF